MTGLDPFLIVRALALYVTVVSTIALWIWRRPARRFVTGVALAFVWNLPMVLVLQLLAARLHWWHFDGNGGLFLGIPVELYLSWAWLWSVVPALVFPAGPLWMPLAFALIVDLVGMPLAKPVIQLGSLWWVGEVAGLAFGVLPGQFLARWTTRDDHLAARASLQVVAFSGLLLFVLPAIAIEGSGGAWRNPAARPGWQISLILQALAMAGLLGLTAVQEFVERGAGTPVPFDPPKRLVSSGIYAYVRNPMQLSAVLLLLMWGLVLENLWVSATAVVAHIYSTGLAGWDEGEDLRQRFGSDWVAYRRGLRRWVPRFRPWYPLDQEPARLYVSESCAICSEVAQWFHARGARHLAIIPAEQHPRELTRITYEATDGTPPEVGVVAIARALEHVHFGWSLIGFVLRLPVIRGLIQLLADASGAEPRTLRA
ncbi:MAG TPA: methyltransferase [Vicinamibacterales bacterium]|jgi:protein-S-isoprenylcysteine O-methyltransferase Ste14|nr:methyltransferase [Vicinamibacterales bacterium]